ncbi:hypothetical protein JTB14_003446 [Gonioctena quinquepunctata]|nr:hypothetical protein JTB14_003446 [Gonioctena quinquepunctata]
MRKHLLSYVLEDPSEWKRLEFQSYPMEFPTLVIRAPVPWHIQYCLSTQLMEKHYYNGNVIVRRIRDLWFERYQEMLIIPLSSLLESNEPLNLSAFLEKVETICDHSREILEKEWLPKCADIFLECKKYWRQYIPKQPSDSVELVERFFECVNTLLSIELRGLVVRSLEHFLSLFIKFKGGNDFEGEYEDFGLINLPIITLW